MKKMQFALLLLIACLQIRAQTMVKEDGLVSNFRNDSLWLSELNTRFIRNFITNDTAAHNEIIYKDFFCITSSGEIIERTAYMKDWAHGYDSSIFISFTKENESIRIFSDIALVRSETLAVFTNKGVITAKGEFIQIHMCGSRAGGGASRPSYLPKVEAASFTVFYVKHEFFPHCILMVCILWLHLAISI